MKRNTRIVAIIVALVMAIGLPVSALLLPNVNYHLTAAGSMSKEEVKSAKEAEKEAKKAKKEAEKAAKNAEKEAKKVEKEAEKAAKKAEKEAKKAEKEAQDADIKRIEYVSRAQLETATGHKLTIANLTVFTQAMRDEHIWVSLGFEAQDAQNIVWRIKHSSNQTRGILRGLIKEEHKTFKVVLLADGHVNIGSA